jgi:hypothetical protein
MLDKTWAYFEVQWGDRENPIRNDAVAEVRALRTLPRIICLCGSTRFREHILNASQRFTLEGNIVLAPNVFGREADDKGKPHDAMLVSGRQKSLLDALHFRKIDLCDQIHVLNIGGYVGRSVHNEVKYAVQRDKLVSFEEDRVVPWGYHSKEPINTVRYIAAIKQSLSVRGGWTGASDAEEVV